jgi:hypothetical protein
MWRSDKPDATAAWYFLSLPFDVSDEIDEIAGGGAGFGSVRVEVTIGTSTWCTSIFPSAGQKTYILPIKKQIRTAERLAEGSACVVCIRVL